MASTSTINAASAAQVDAAQMNTFRSYVTMLGDPTAKDEIKMKAAQELSENFELITQCSGFQLFLEHSMKIFIKILHDGDPLFISEYNLQQVIVIFIGYLWFEWSSCLTHVNSSVREMYIAISSICSIFVSTGSKIDFGNDPSIANQRNSPSICWQHTVVDAETAANR